MTIEATVAALRAALLDLALCFGRGPESEEWWEGWIDAMACDCVNPDHPHTTGAIRGQMLERAHALLARPIGGDYGNRLASVGVDGATSSHFRAMGILSPDSVEAQPVVPLTEHESCDAAAVFHELLKREDPYALTRTIEHVLKMRTLTAIP